MKETLTLSAKEQQRSEVVSRWLAGIVTTAEAALLLGCSERTAWRLRAAMVRGGAAGLAHGNRGRSSPRRLPDATADRIVELATTEYRGFNDTHLAEALAETRASRSAARPCAGSCARAGSPPRGGGGRRGTAAGGSGCPRRASWSRLTAAGTTGSRGAGPG